MHKISSLFALLALTVLAACSSTSQRTQFAQGPTAATAAPIEPLFAEPTSPPPAQQVADARAGTDIAAFVDPAALGAMSTNSRNQALGAQFNSLNFGRPGAPRNWQGDNNVSGVVVVGPYVRVNAIDCRDFTHTVTAAGQSYARKGTACREVDGRWSVVEGRTAG